MLSWHHIIQFLVLTVSVAPFRYHMKEIFERGDHERAMYTVHVTVQSTVAGQMTSQN